MNILLQFVSDKHAESLKASMNINGGMNGIGTYNGSNRIENDLNSNSNEKDLMIEKIKPLGKINVLEIGDEETFINFNRKKDYFCAKCSEPALYGKNDLLYIKCLNCFNKVCKFCTRDYSLNHFDLATKDYCKVYYRKSIPAVAQYSFCKEFCTTFGFFVVGYLLVLLTFYTKMSLTFQKVFYIESINKESQNIHYYRLKYMLYLLCLILLSILSVPLMVLMINFFPSFVNMFNIIEE